MSVLAAIQSRSRPGLEIGVVIVAAYVATATLVLVILGAGPWTLLILVGPTLVFGFSWLVRGDLAILPHVYIPSLLLSPSLLTELEGVSKGIRADHIVIGLGLVLITYQALKGDRIRINKILGALMLLYLASVLAAVAIRLLGADSPDAISELIGFQGLARPFLVFFVFLNVIKSQSQIRDLVLITVGVGGIVIGIMMLQYLEIGRVIDFTAEHFDRKEPSVLFVGRGVVVGTFDGLHNAAGIFAMAYVTIIISILWSSPRSFSKVLRLLIWTLVGFTFVAILATFSRSAAIALFAGLVTMTMLNRKIAVGRNVRMVVTLGLIGLIAIAVVQTTTGYVSGRFGREIFSPSVIASDPRVTKVLPSMMSKFLDRPLLGNGFDLGTASDIGYATELAARGLIGFVLYFTMVIYVLRAAYKTFTRADLGSSRVVGGALLAMTFGLFAAALGNDAFWSTRLVELYWIFVAATVVSYSYVKQGREGTLPEADRPESRAFATRS